MRSIAHPPLFPYAVARLRGIVYLQEALSSTLTEVQLRAIVARRAAESGKSQCLVFAPDRAVFFEPDGKATESTKPPTGGVLYLRVPSGKHELLGATELLCPNPDGPPLYIGNACFVLGVDATNWLEATYGIECDRLHWDGNPKTPGIELDLLGGEGLDIPAIEAEVRARFPAAFIVAVEWKSLQGEPNDQS